MAVTFTSFFVLAALALGATTGGFGPYKAAAVGIVMLAAAVVVLVNAHRSFDRLTARRDALRREIEGNS